LPGKELIFLCARLRGTLIYAVSVPGAKAGVAREINVP
jgi:hypothetical protein